LDKDDKEMYNQDTIDKLKKIKNLSYFFGKSENKVSAINRDLKSNDNWDILLLASDDMIPQIKGYDSVIRDNMTTHFPDTDGVLWFNDGNRKDLNTLSILGKKYYQRFNYIYNPIDLNCEIQPLTPYAGIRPTNLLELCYKTHYLSHYYVSLDMLNIERSCLRSRLIYC
jgi:hypothetical protein